MLVTTLLLPGPGGGGGAPSPEALASPLSNPGFLPTGIFIALLLRFDIR